MPECTLLLTTDLINKAIDLITPTVIASMSSGRFKRPILAVKVMIADHPELTVERWIKLDADYQTEERFMKIARAKAEAALRTGMSTGQLVHEYPHLLKPTDCVYPGGVYEVGIAVACSAFKAYHDQFVAWLILNAIIVVCQEVADKMTTDEDHADFVGECLTNAGL